MKWYNFETTFEVVRDELRAFLKSSGIYYELSQGEGFYHFEIKCAPSDLDRINSFLDTI